MKTRKIICWVKEEVTDYKILLRNVPTLVTALFIVSVILMNILANKEIYTGTSWLALDCGICVSWLSFLCMDMLNRRFGPKAATKISILATGVNLAVCSIFFLISNIPGNWGQYYVYQDNIINDSLNNTLGGTWYVLLGSTVAFLISSIVNSSINYTIGTVYTSDSFKVFALRSYVSTFFAQFIDNFIFALIVSYNFFGWSMLQCITCSITGGILELLCEVVFSPIGYKVCKRWEKGNIGNKYITYVSTKKEGN